MGLLCDAELDTLSLMWKINTCSMTYSGLDVLALLFAPLFIVEEIYASLSGSSWVWISFDLKGTQEIAVDVLCLLCDCIRTASSHADKVVGDFQSSPETINWDAHQISSLARKPTIAEVSPEKTLQKCIVCNATSSHCCSTSFHTWGNQTSLLLSSGKAYYAELLPQRGTKIARSQTTSSWIAQSWQNHYADLRYENCAKFTAWTMMQLH